MGPFQAGSPSSAPQGLPRRAARFVGAEAAAAAEAAEVAADEASKVLAVFAVPRRTAAAAARHPAA